MSKRILVELDFDGEKDKVLGEFIAQDIVSYMNARGYFRQTKNSSIFFRKGRRVKYVKYISGDEIPEYVVSKLDEYQTSLVTTYTVN